MTKFKFILAVGLIGACFTAPTRADEQAEKKTDALSQCYAEIGDQPRPELLSCLEKYQKEARAALDAKLQSVEKDIKDTDSSASETALKSLAASQQAFDAFLKAECQRVSDAAMGGTGASDFALGCAVDLLRWRTKQLDD